MKMCNKRSIKMIYELKENFNLLRTVTDNFLFIKMINKMSLIGRLEVLKIVGIRFEGDSYLE